MLHQKIITSGEREFLVRWSWADDNTKLSGATSLGRCFAACINVYRLPFLHKTVDGLLGVAQQWADYEVSRPGGMANNLGKPESVIEFLLC